MIELRQDDDFDLSIMTSGSQVAAFSLQDISFDQT